MKDDFHRFDNKVDKVVSNKPSCAVPQFCKYSYILIFKNLQMCCSSTSAAAKCHVLLKREIGYCTRLAIVYDTISLSD